MASRRQAIADMLSSRLPDGIKVHPYRPNGARPFHGWLEATQVDTEDATFGDLRVHFNVVILVASDQATFERCLDRYAAALIDVLSEIGRGITVRPFTETVTNSSTLYCVVATLITESEAA